MKQFYQLCLGYGCVLVLTLALVQWGSTAVTVFYENVPPERRHTVVIDPGHGGVDGGAVSCSGVSESQINLEIGLRLNDLMRFLGYRTRMTRMEDISVYSEGETIAQKKMSDLKNRVKMVNETENALLLSIHQNYFSDGRYFGPQVLYADQTDSLGLAKQLQAALIRGTNPESRRTQTASEGIYLLKHIRCTGVLIECGFLSNPEEEARLRSREYQQTLCSIIACTAANYLSNT